MKDLARNLANGLVRLVEVKSIVTIAMTVAMVTMVFRAEPVSGEVLALFSSAYGSVITYFFTRKSE